MHKETTQTITDKGAKPIIVQLPPVYYPQLRADQRNRDTEILNEILSERHGNAIAKTNPITIHRTQMKPDGLHLTLESANTMAKEIAKTIRENKKDQDSEEEITITPESTKDDLNTQLITTTKNIAAKLIGKGGERINKIKNLHNVNITSEQPPDHENERRFTVTGTQEDTTQAIKLMKKIIKDTLKQDQEHQRKQEYTNPPPPPPPQVQQANFPVQCRYYSWGQCTKGKGCRFLHQMNVPADISEHSEADSTPEETTRTITIQPKQTNNRNRQDEPKPHHSKDTRRHTPPPREERTKKRKEGNTTPPQQRRSRSPTKKSRKQEERNNSPSPSTSHRTKHYERNSSPYKKSRSNKQRDYSPTSSTLYRPTRKSSTISHRPKSHNRSRSSPTPQTSRSHKKDRSRSRSRRNQTPIDTRSRTHRTRTPSPEHRRRRRSTTPPDRYTRERQDRYRSNRWDEDEELQSALWTILSRTKHQ